MNVIVEVEFESLVNMAKDFAAEACCIPTCDVCHPNGTPRLHSPAEVLSVYFPHLFADGAS